MAKIFISHSARDESIKNFFLQAFAGTNVRPLFEEFEQEIPTGITAQKIEMDIRSSNAIFVLISENTDSVPHTRDWISWEHSTGSTNNKEVWVFEPAETLGRLNVIFPTLTHYFVYEQTDEYRKLIRNVISYYDDTHVLPVIAASAAGGAALNERDRAGGAWIGALAGLAGLAVTSLARKKLGLPIKCFKCLSIYTIYRIGQFRCPVCNQSLVVTQQNLVDAYNNQPDAIPPS